ncbi:MAG: hypothetical protein Q4E02_03490 [Lagierella massiliensis]|nr:hypothetical protein [Lagierella massiliensis]
MANSIKTNLDIIESLLYFWQATSEGEKVGESYMASITDMEDMKYIYNDEFKEDNARKVLSAISNKELLSHANKTERRFWNNNMWMMEDLGFTNMMVAPVKQLHSDKFLDAVNKNPNKDKFEKIEIVFVPGHFDEYYMDENRLIINFFKIMVDIFDEEKITIDGKPFDDYIEEKLIELIEK